MRRYRMPEQSIPKEAAYQIISDELMLDGNPRLNLASFVTTWMEPECGKLIRDSVTRTTSTWTSTPSPPSSRSGSFFFSFLHV
jgi:glutamate/tyrosine decarboxylase-like PLP-dependent enzyme